MIWKCRDKEIEYGNRILLMGIVNVTPDSFSDGGDHFLPEDAVSCALQLEKDGADIIDIGAQSTRPGHIPVSEKEEWERLEPVLNELMGRISVPVSVDTYYPSVAEKALEKGVHIINDVSAAVSPEMARLVKKEKCGWIIMHSGPGKPEDVRAFFEESAEKCRAAGIDKSRICFDMGIGFGKDYDENMVLLTHIGDYKLNDYPLVLASSRKRVIGRGSAQEDPKQRIYGNIAADTAAVFGGADIIRLHDIKNEKQGILMAWNMKGYV